MSVFLTGLRRLYLNLFYKRRECPYTLTDILNLAIRESPYYIQLGIKEPVLEKFPFLTKDIIRKNYRSLLTHTAFRKRNYWWNTSGGSTGEPVRIAQNREYLYINRFYEVKQYLELGWRPGEPVVKLWGDEREILKGYAGLRRKFVELLKGEYILNTFVMDYGKIRAYLEFINLVRPTIIVGYVSSLVEISKYILENNVKIHRPKAIISSAGTLYPQFRKTIEEAFQVPVFNKYGSREVGMIAYEDVNSYKKFLWVTPMNYVEEVNGELVITSLANTVMPLIRYRIGDMGKVEMYGDKPVLKELMGRTVEVFVTRDGKLVDGEFFTHLLYFRRGIRKFRFIQEDYDFVLVQIELEEGVGRESLAETMRSVESGIKKVMGKGTKVEFEFPDRIPPLPSGKFVYTISKVR